jgi:hypothetical protein
MMKGRVTFDEVEIETVSEFIEKIEGLPAGEKSFYRGQPVDAPLLPAVARSWNRTNLVAMEQSYLREFERRAAAFHDVSRLSDWDLLALAQHNGAPTRLLDWTRNPLAALWFAISTEPKKKSDRKAVIWRVTIDDEDHVSREDREKSPFEITRSSWFAPPHISPRILAQEGYFSIHRFSISSKGYVPLEKQSEFSRKLKKFTVRAGREDGLFAQLDRLGVNYASLFPDLYGLSMHLAARHEFKMREISFKGAMTLMSRLSEGA